MELIYRYQSGNSVQRSRQLVKKTNSIKQKYSGGNRDQARSSFIAQEPIIPHVIDSIAGAYNINPKTLDNRFKHEGYLDYLTDRRNKLSLKKQQDRRGYNLVHEKQPADFGKRWFGMDDTGILIQQGKVKPINEKYTINGRSVSGKTAVDNIGLQAATLKYYQDLVKKDFPKATPEQVARYTVIYYNAGPSGGKKLINKGTTRPEYNINK